MKYYVFCKLDKDRKARPVATKPFEDLKRAQAVASQLAQEFRQREVPFKVWVRDESGEIVWQSELIVDTEG